eukprot:276917-Pelagomonas_calceolata.AAC.3
MAVCAVQDAARVLAKLAESNSFTSVHMSVIVGEVSGQGIKGGNREGARCIFTARGSCFWVWE